MRISIPINLSELKEAKPVPNGRYGLTIASVEEGESQKGLPQLKASVAIDGHDDSPNITHFISLPSPNDDKSEAKAIFLARFLTTFSIPFDEGGFDLDDFPGAAADNVEVTLSKPDDSGNVYNRIVLPKLPDSDEPKGRTAPPPPKS